MTLQTDLTEFTGTLEYHKLTFSPMLATDGVKYFADKAKAYWLISDIAAVHYIKRRKYDFITIKVVCDGNTARAFYSDGDGNNFYKQEYTITDLPQGEYKFFLTDDVLMLSSEY